MNSALPGNPLQNLQFDNRFVRELPADQEQMNVPRQVDAAFYSRVSPQGFKRPKLLAYSQEMAQTLGLDRQSCESEEFLLAFSGQKPLPGMETYACCYGGHQFGNWAGQLGDGRAINLGEVVNAAGQHWTLQLKGAGPTPYSRTADGLAVLRSSVREFLCSEAMHHLGVPTTRALSLITTGESVSRDMFYDGNPEDEPGAIVCRAAPSFTRFGNFEIFTFRQQHDLLKQLADFTIKHDFPHLGNPCRENYGQWFREICLRTADMIVHWMRVGFVHGVMNTDNMSILGLTIDYGPYGWLEDFNPNWTPNTTDAQGRRYRFGHQAQIALWNLVQLANALYPLFNEANELEDALDGYKQHYDAKWREMMANKLGFSQFQEDLEPLIGSLLKTLQSTETDMTIFFRQLADLDVDTEDDNAALQVITPAFYQADALSPELKKGFIEWLRDYRAKVRSAGLNNEDRHQLMNRTNPKYVLRNYLAQEAIDQAAEGDPSLIHELLDVLRKPYDQQPGKDRFAEKRPEWARHRPGCSMLSCSS